MEWRKMGRIHAPTGKIPWAQQYAFPPTPDLVNEDILRLYVAFRDADGVGRVGFVEVDARNPGVVRRVSPAPVLDVGTAGAFDENGVVPTAVVHHNDHLYMYYAGHQLDT